jgi:hypothetical protein
MQQRAQDAPHMRVVVAQQKPQFVEIDAKHGPAPGAPFVGLPGVNYMPPPLTNGCS